MASIYYAHCFLLTRIIDVVSREDEQKKTGKPAFPDNWTIRYFVTIIIISSSIFVCFFHCSCLHLKYCSVDLDFE